MSAYGSWVGSTTNSANLFIHWDLGSGPDRDLSNLNAWNDGATNDFSHSSQTEWVGTTGSTFYLTGVQLEVGEQATPFEHRSYGEELALCQRYYTLIAEGTSKPIAVAMNYTSTNMYSTIHLPTDMRASPTIEVTSGTNYYQFIRNIGADNIDDFFLQMTSNRIVEINNTSDISGTSGHAGFIRTNNAASKFALKAEL